MNPLWESDAIVVGGEQVTVQARGGMVVLTRLEGDHAIQCRWTPRAAFGAAQAHLAIAEALANAANRVQQAIEATRAIREGGAA